MKKICIGILAFILFIPTSYALNKIDVTLNKCVDGDTAWFNLNNEKIKVRFLAIDTPESTNKIEKYGNEASKYVCDILTNASKIEIEYDENSNKLDKYNRHLVWVFVDDTLLQESIVKNGFAEVKYIYGDYKYLPQVNEALKFAKKNKLNLWNNYQKDNINYIFIASIIIIFLIFVFNKNERKKIIKQFKSTIKKSLKKSLNNLK